jgi:(1->4)-alpha-D-glucan 1-alpha-D-glucosylmutase
MIDEATINDVFKKVERRVVKVKRYPVSTYRLQFNHTFTFRDAAALVPYLHELGITDIYASPYLKARPGSLHGYNITDHNNLNPEIGSDEDYRNYIAQLQKYEMGQVLDFVPNHMSIIDSPWWTDVLENGPSSPYAQFFDIDWYPVKAELREKVLLPILEDHYGKMLETGRFRLSFHRGAFFVHYSQYILPLDLRTSVLPLEDCLERLRRRLNASHADFREMQGIITACRDLTARYETALERVNARLREKEMIKKRLWELYERNNHVRMALAETLGAFNGNVNDSRSFDRLHELLEQQAYRLSYWRVALDEINYRRFFDISELAALRIEDKHVFDLCHRLVFKLIQESAITGLRIDHIDGLFAPAEYLWRLQQALFLRLCREETDGFADLSEAQWSLWEKKFLERYEKERGINPESEIARPLFVVVEKILGEKEKLPETWPVDGSTGYEFAVALNGLFVNRGNARKIDNIYRWFTSTAESYEDITYNCKNIIMRTSMSAETQVLARRLDRISEKSRRHRDFTLNNLKDAIREVIACFPVYRTYINALEGSISESDKDIINTAVTRAGKRNPAMSTSLFDFLRDTLLLEYPPDMDEEGRREQQQFVMRFQQLTGPVMAKGVEDTALYRYYPLVSLNDVGGNPDRFGCSLNEFHRRNISAQRTRRYSLLATSTHDSKRSEDVRSRINILSEIPDIWKTALAHWSRLNRRKKIIINGESIPDRNEEYLIYQTLLGSYPAGEMDQSASDNYKNRIREYILKAIREAKVHTSWISPDNTYEEGVANFIIAILDPSPSNSFLADFRVLNKLVAYCGLYNSLAQVVLKIFSPGIPDFYQGNELWNYRLVDPDNRGLVDFTRRRQLLESLKMQAGRDDKATALAMELMGELEQGEAKLYVTWRALNHRRQNTSLFNEGTYIPLPAAGNKNDNLCAFAWQKEGKQTLIIVPRLIAKLTQNGNISPVGAQAWGDTELILPGRFHTGTYRNIFTGEMMASTISGRQTVLPLAKALAIFPVAVLELVSS